MSATLQTKESLRHGEDKHGVEASAGLAEFIEDVEKRIQTLGQSAATKADESGLKLYFALKELEFKWENASEKLRRQAEKLGRLADATKTATDTVKVRAHLARAEVRDVAQDLKERLHGVERRLRQLKRPGENELEALVGRLQKAAAHLRQDLEGRH